MFTECTRTVWKNEDEVIIGWARNGAEESAFCSISYEGGVTWESLWTCCYSKWNGSINSSAINRQAVRTADLKIDFLKIYWFVLFSLICTCMKSKIREYKGKITGSNSGVQEQELWSQVLQILLIILENRTCSMICFQRKEHCLPLNTFQNRKCEWNERKKEKEEKREGEKPECRRALCVSRSAAICAARNSVDESDRLFQKSAQSLLSYVICDYRLSGSWRS